MTPDHAKRLILGILFFVYVAYLVAVEREIRRK